MKIEAYLPYCGEAGLSRAVAAMMALFGVLPLTAPAAGRVVAAVENETDEASPPDVATTLLLRRDGQILRRMVRRSRALDDEDRPVAVKKAVSLNLWNLLCESCGAPPSPWGTLSGVRPTKLAHKLLDRRFGEPEIARRLTDYYAVREDRARLLVEIARRQRPLLLAPEAVRRVVGVYIGVPFCPSRCLYCSFPSYVRPGQAELSAFCDALARDIAAARRLIDRYGLQVESVYIGGGTPTSLQAGAFGALLQTVRRLLIQTTTREFTVEAGRPDSMDDAKIGAMADYGVTRVSINPQTMREKTLKRIGRNHTVHDIIDMFHAVRRRIPAAVINMDVIAGLPGETEADVAATMERLAALGPDNVTIHTLALKKGSALKTNLSGYPLPDERATARMLAVAKAAAGRMGLAPYYLYRQKYMNGNLENIGYARPDALCRYNVQMMEERQTIIGVGPAATTKVIDGRDWSLTACFYPKEYKIYMARLDEYLDRREKLFRQQRNGEELFLC